MSIRPLLLAALLASGVTLQAQAATSPLAGDGTWQEFAVSQDLSGTLAWGDSLDASQAITFTFTVGAGQQGVLTVVDTGFAGDMFTVFNGATMLGSSSSVAAHTYSAADTAETDFDTALANASYSRATFTLGQGTYTITGVMTQSVTDSLGPLNATSGGVKLDILAVPEPDALLLMLAGSLVLAATRRARRTV